MMRLLKLLIILLAYVQISQSYAQDLPLQLIGHGGPIKAISVSADGKTALTASFDYSIGYWDLTKPEGQIIHWLKGHDAAVNDVAFFEGDNRAVSVSDDGSLGIWNLIDGSLVKRIVSTDHKVLGVAVSPDGKYAAVARWDATVRVYDLNTLSEKYVLARHRGNVNSVAFSRDGTHIYSSAYDGQILEWEVKTGRFVRPVYRHGWGINSIAILDESRILFGALDGTSGIVDIATGYVLTELAKRDYPIQSVKVSTDNTFAAYSDSKGKIEVVEARSGTPIEIGQVTYGPVWDFDFVGDTNQIYHVGLDDFATRWQISPRKLNQIKAEYPRRFQVRNTDDPGELEFRRKCSVCHTLEPDDANRAGPTLYKLFGRKAGTLPGYKYSKALLEANIIWTEKTVSQLFDDGPDIMVPGTKMPIQRLKKIKRREELVQFLKSATEPDKP